MPQSLSQIYLHVVFSTKNRSPFLRELEIRQRMHVYLTGACKNLKCPSIKIGGVEDHVHILCRFGKTITVADMIRELKRESSKWAKEKWPQLANFHWQAGYGAFSISPAHVNPVARYIADQEEHHRRESFEDEFRRLCKKYGVDLDERYAWD